VLLRYEHYRDLGCAPYVRRMSEQRRPQISEEKQTAIDEAAFKSLVRDLPYGLIICAAGILVVFGIVIAALENCAP
jgi:hypothetical protein